MYSHCLHIFPWCLVQSEPFQSNAWWLASSCCCNTLVHFTSTPIKSILTSWIQFYQNPTTKTAQQKSTTVSLSEVAVFFTHPFGRSGLRIDVKVWCSSLQRCRQLLRCLKLLPHLVTKKFLSTYPLARSNYMVSTILITWSFNLSLKQLWATGSLFASRHEGEPRDQHWTTMIFSTTKTKWGVWKRCPFWIMDIYLSVN